MLTANRLTHEDKNSGCPWTFLLPLQVVAIRFHQNDVSTFESICRRILPLWNLDFRLTTRPPFKQPFIEYYILDNEHKSAPYLFE